MPDRPISLEVFSDDFAEMERQAPNWQPSGDNVYVKIPVTNTQGECDALWFATLTQEVFKVNVTAMMTLAQVEEVRRALAGSAGVYI